MYTDKNSPFIPEAVKQQSAPVTQPYQPKYPPTTNKFDQPKILPKPLVDLQVYEQTKPRPKQSPWTNFPDINSSLYTPMYGQSPYFPPQYNPFWPNFYTPQLTSPVINAYSINASGPMDDHSKISFVMEGILPSKHYNNTSNTLGERINLYNYIRSVFIRYHDGEDIDLNGKGNNSILKYLKFLELNPYNPNQLSNNPYKGLPDDMLIYSSCYPIRYDDKTGAIKCAANSIGMNVRIYKLNNKEYDIKKQEKDNFYDFDIWREVAYYEYVREQIVKKKMCPNFTILHCYYISEKCNIDFKKLAELKGKPKYPVLPKPIVTYTPTVPNLINPMTSTLPLKYHVPPFIPFTVVQDDYSGKGLVSLTEAPTYNIFEWASKTYNSFGNIKKMVNSGYHKSEVWMSVLFQIIVALYVLQMHGIVFTNFSMEDNIYIKDISQHENVTTFWKYKIDDFEYYVPNYGYLVLIDSNYKDINPQQYTLIKSQNQKIRKIYSNIFNDANKISDVELHDKCFQAFLSIFNPNVFSNSFSNSGGTDPPEDIKKLITEIYNAATVQNANTDINYYIFTFMRKLLNNRVGTLLTENEIKNVRKDDVRLFNPGQIIAHEIQNGTFKFVIFAGEDDIEALILTKKDLSNDIIDIQVPKTSLYNYSKYEPIVQNYKPAEAILTEDDLLETYIVNK